MTLKAPLPPIGRFPKFRLDELMVRSAVAAIPVPLNETLLGDVEALVMMEISPANAPGVFGEKLTSNVDCFPAATTTGREIPAIFTPAAAVLACVTVTSEEPPFMIVTDCDALLPTATLPKCNALGSTDSPATLEVCEVEPGFDEPVRPMHPEPVSTRRSRSVKAENEIDLPVKFAILARWRGRPNG